METALLFLILALSFCINLGQPVIRPTNIQGIQLGNSNDYGNQGRVEILYNNTWGTICDTSWSYSDGRVACRMLGYSDVVCPTMKYRTNEHNQTFPIWMSHLLCIGTEPHLDHCAFYGWRPEAHICRYDAGVVCKNASLLDIPEVSVENTTSRTIAISWPANYTIPAEVDRYRYVVQYNTSTSSSTRLRYISVNRYNLQNTRYYATIINLKRDTDYSISVRFELGFTACSSYNYRYTYMPGFYSDPITVRTNITVRESLFEVRLISPIQGFDFLGRVEVLYNNVWGTVCDYGFNSNAADVVCGMLNYTESACTVTNARMGKGSGMIWLNRVRCRGAEILDDCHYNLRSSYSPYCSVTHHDDVGVICMPDDPNDFLPAPEEFNITSNQVTSLTYSWKLYNFPSYVRSRRLVLQYTRSDTDYIYTRIIPHLNMTYTITRLSLGITVNATIRPQAKFKNYRCYSFIDGANSNSKSITILERAPSGPPQFFHISVVNCSAIRAEWDLPSYEKRNGIVRGYKLMILLPSGREIVRELTNNLTEYIIGDLKASTMHVVSVLAYTVEDGPRSIYLTATTNPEDICQTDIIDIFGIHGNGIDKITLYTSHSGNVINILCGSSLPGVDINWLLPNGTKVGISDRDILEGYIANGTSALQFRRITLCISDLYICRANQTVTGMVQQRTLKVKVNIAPPTPERPIILKVTSTTTTISWAEVACNGGHDLQYFTIKIGYSNIYFFINLAYSYINNINANLNNYTVIGLTSNTNYQISLRAEGKDNTYSNFSGSVSFTTLQPAPNPPGDVSVELITPDTILVSWTKPSVSTGRIVYYTVYATQLTENTIMRPAQSFQVTKSNFSSFTSSGPVTIHQQGVEYQIQVSATVLDSVSSTNIESKLSAPNPNATIFIPIQGLPFPRRVSIFSSSNVSLTLAWDAPTTTGYTINGYMVEYTAVVEGRSPLGNLISFMHDGTSTSISNVNKITVQPLIPQTNYLFKVAALTTGGEGMQVRANGLTNDAASEFERFVYFNSRFGPVLSCSGFRKDIEGQKSIVKEQILEFLNDMCNCGLTDTNIEKDFFRCGQKDHQIIYRAHILGTRNYSAIDLVDLLQFWIASDNAYIQIDSIQLQLDPTCPSRLDTLDDPECPPFEVTTSKSKPAEPSQKTEKPLEKAFGGIRHEQGRAVISAAGIGGTFVGVIIAILLLLVIIMFGIAFFWRKARSLILPREINDGNSPRNTEFENQDTSTENNLYEKLD